MDIQTLCDLFASAIAQDPALSLFGETEYDTAPTVYVNVDPRQPPQASNCPFVAIWPTSKTGGTDEQVATFEVVCCLHDETSQQTHDSRIVQFAGVYNIETMRRAVSAAISGADLGTASVASIETEYDTIELFPFFIAAMTVTVTEPWTIGENPFE